jgi:CheY-like chemotaxis protein
VPSSPTAPIGTAGKIILVEEYDALTVAFGSVLRRLRPDYQTQIVRSLAAAEAAADQGSPDLLVIDFDPPHRGAVEFFERMRVAHPSTRVLVIAANTWPELVQERVSSGAFRFIEKPFELAQFEAALAALLPERRGRTAPATSSALRHLELTDMVALLGVASATTVLNVATPAGRTGEIPFSGGQILHAAAVEKTGLPALEEMLRWRTPQFSESEIRADVARTIQQPWNSVLSTALRAVRLTEPRPEPTPQPPPPPSTPETTIVVIDDTDLLLDFVEDVLRTTLPSLGVTSAAKGVEGLLRIAETMPHLVLLDYSLPDITGAEVCRRLLEDPHTAHIPVIMMSGHVAEMVTTAARSPNIVATIAKPFLSTELIGLVGETILNLPKLVAEARRRTRRRRQQSPPKEIPPAEDTLPSEAEPSPPESDFAEISEPVIPPSAASEAVPSSGPESQPPTNISRENTEAVEAPPAASEPLRQPRAHSPPPQASAEPTLPLPEQPAVEPSTPPPQAPTFTGSAVPASIPEAKQNAVVLAMPLEVTSIQLSTALEIRAIRAKPYSRNVSVHILPEPKSSATATSQSFELDQVDLDARGQMATVRLTPAVQPIEAPPLSTTLMVADLSVTPQDGGGTLQILPGAVSPMRIQLLALFELIGIELAAGFRIGHLVLRTCNAKVRVNLTQENAHTGVTFRTAQILLDHSSRIAEVLFDAVE